MQDGILIQSFLASTIKSPEMDKRLRKFIFLFLSFAIELKTLIPVRIGRRIGKRNKFERYGVKRMHRFTSNKKLNPKALNRILLRNFLKQVHRKKSVILAMDWTIIREKFCFLSISLVWSEGRSVPIGFWGYKKGEMTESQPQIEREAMALVLKALGKRRNVIMLADRGFDAPETLKYLENAGVYYIIRASTESICRKSNGRRFKLRRRIVKRGRRRVLSNISYCEQRTVTTNLYAIWNKDQKEPWLLLSNLRFRNAQPVANLYARRMTIEEMFRSLKNEQTGFDLKKVRLDQVDRWLRFLFLAALLFQLLAKLGSLLREVPRIEQRYSLSSRVPRKQKAIFSIYMLAVLALNDALLQFRLIGQRLYIRFPDTRWLWVG